ncbi:HNH endonuclease signature motif containing protein [Microbacterium sediminicola]|uniref:HNH endonuclease signature motif containing protein n=1 Tax=Microbacterium sediminicola TaxID=415210 RepID=A0ABN2HZ72_9MICO
MTDELAAQPSKPRAAEVIAGLAKRVAMLRSTIATLQAAEIATLAVAMEIAHQEADQLESAASRERDMPLRSIAAEIGAQLRVSDRTIQRQMADAAEQMTRMPAAFRSLSEGRISRAHLRVICDAGLAIADDHARAEYEEVIVPLAEVESVSRVRPAAQRLAAQLSAATFEERHKVRRAERAVRVVDLDDGMAELIAPLPALLAYGIHDRLTQFARLSHDVAASTSTSTSTDTDTDTDTDTEVPQPDRRTIDQRRADILCELLLASTPESMAGAAGSGPLGNIQARVELRVPVLSLIGTQDTPAELIGRGPVDITTARTLTGTAPGWDRVLTDPVSGNVLEVDRYRPSEHLRRTLRVRDEHCRFPGCRMPTFRCDIDHTVDAARGGPTSASNLAHLCRRHHSLKHATPWQVVQRPGGVLAWTSPGGKHYMDRPPRELVAGERVRFRPLDDSHPDSSYRPPDDVRPPDPPPF